MLNVKWIGAAAGWFFGGPIGGIIGYYVGKNFFSSKVDNKKAFEISLLILSSVVIKADGKVLKSELNYVKKFFTNTFGTKKSRYLIPCLTNPIIVTPIKIIAASVNVTIMWLVTVNEYGNIPTILQNKININKVNMNGKKDLALEPAVSFIIFATKV